MQPVYPDLCLLFLNLAFFLLSEFTVDTLFCSRIPPFRLQNCVDYFIPYLFTIFVVSLLLPSKIDCLSLMFCVYTRVWVMCDIVTLLFSLVVIDVLVCTFFRLGNGLQCHDYAYSDLTEASSNEC